MKRAFPIASVDLPEGWEDRSTYHFVSPEPEALAAPLASARGGDVRAPRVSVMIESIGRLDRPTLEALLADQERTLRQQFPSFRLHERGVREHPSGSSCPTIEMSYELAPGSSVAQTQIYFESSGLRLTLSCDARVRERARPMFDQIFASVTPVGLQ
jgi:hypothetical protein